MASGHVKEAPVATKRLRGGEAWVCMVVGLVVCESVTVPGVCVVSERTVEVVGVKSDKVGDPAVL